MENFFSLFKDLYSVKTGIFSIYLKYLVFLLTLYKEDFFKFIMEKSKRKLKQPYLFGFISVVIMVSDNSPQILPHMLH